MGHDTGVLPGSEEVKGQSRGNLSFVLLRLKFVQFLGPPAVI